MPKWKTNLILAALLGLLACGTDPMQDGRTAVAAGNADAAEAAFRKVLKKDPENVEARRMMATVQRIRGEYEAAATSLESLWAEQGFDAKAKLSPSEKTLEKLMKDQLGVLYAEWSANIDSKAHPAKFVKVTKSGIMYDPKSIALNARIVEFHVGQAERAVESGEALKAAEEFEKVQLYRTTPELRAEVTLKAKLLRQEAFHNSVLAKFEAAKPRLLAQTRYDESQNTISIQAQAEFDFVIRKTAPESLKRAQDAMIPSVGASLANLITEVTGVSIPENAHELYGMPKHVVVAEKIRRKSYEKTLSMTLRDAEAYAFQVAEQARTSK